MLRLFLLNILTNLTTYNSAAYEQQVSFLVNRQAAFKRAALDAKKHGDKTAAIEYLRKMKGFDNMIEAARNGLKVIYLNFVLINTSDSMCTTQSC